MKAWRDLSNVVMPNRVLRLERDCRGYPIPYTVQRDAQGRPDFRVVDPQIWMNAVRYKRCGICGEQLGVHLAFVGGPACMQNRVFTDLPMHRDCATYALQVCPFLAAPKFAYSRSLSGDVRVMASVSSHRPEQFGLAMSRGVELRRLGDDLVLLAAPFDSVEWWQGGIPMSEALGQAVSAA